ncbi:hypothetical protein [Rhodospira trueperi]|uniref:Uncharacterized protein n=1 Tax=Rhodospira trueperi TaxID=69960 RepID=A0A1G7BZB8_9PROT|nr:hypothetical protein [Rhodospira trueperi]SDE32444.1 hypothetical protein SAMN05421720_105238 [Rhodospira trueperi]
MRPTTKDTGHAALLWILFESRDRYRLEPDVHQRILGTILSLPDGMATKRKLQKTIRVACDELYRDQTNLALMDLVDRYRSFQATMVRSTEPCMPPAMGRWAPMSLVWPAG